MEYAKPSLSFVDQANLLMSRGLIADKDALVSLLTRVNYYRLSAYLYPFRRSAGAEDYQSGTTLEKVMEIYRFDEELRDVLAAGIEVVEISFRAQIARAVSQSCGPFGYADRANVPEFSQTERLEFYRTIESERDQSREVFKEHFFKKYGDVHKYLPIWMAVELMSFGTLHSLLNGIDYRLRQTVATTYGIDQTVLVSWFRALNALRNMCAHHSRVWNREFGVKPMVPRKEPLWNTPAPVAYITGRIDPRADWRARFLELLSRRGNVPLTPMGFPDHWESYGPWR